MPRLSLYRPEKGNDYKFIDKTSWEMFQVGGTDVLMHKYLGAEATADTAGTPSQPKYDTLSPTNIQDMLFLENRDRKYSPDVFVMRGVYNVQDIDFNLSQFGLFLQNDTIFITFHINDTVEKLGRKIIPGDVIELPHLKDEYALNDLNYALKRFYVVEDVNRAAEGFSVTWYPHLYRAKCKPLVDSQEFKDILDGIANQEGFKGEFNIGNTYYPGDVISYNGEKYEALIETTDAPPSSAWKLADTLKDIMSTYEKEMQITDAVLNQAEADTPQSGYDTTKFYTLQRTPEGKSELVSADTTLDDATLDTVTADAVYASAEANGYKGYITGDGIPPNGAPFTQGIAFPLGPSEGQFHLRTDYKPTRLFRYAKGRWSKVEDDVRTNITNLGNSDTDINKQYEGKENRQTQKTSFINNTNTNIIDGQQVTEKQSLSQALKPRADE
jgi:hypothetical protein